MKYSSYKPNMDDDYAKKIKKWHENAYKELKNRKTETEEYLGLKLVIPPKVHPITGMSDLLGNAVLNEVRTTDRVLDMGTGCGVNAILAASKSTDVVGVDINPNSIECAKQNAERNNVQDRISLQVSDLFKEVKGKFDLIIFDPPFRWFVPRDIHEISITDENYQVLTQFFEEVKDYLAEKGRLLMFFGDSGDIKYFNQLVEKSGFKKEIIAEKSLTKEEITITYYTYKLTS